jgi:hypothetical protein
MKFEGSAFRDSVMGDSEFKKHLSFDNQTKTFEYHRVYNNLEFEGNIPFRVSNQGLDTLKIEIVDERNLVNRDSSDLSYDDIQSIAPKEFTEIFFYQIKNFQSIVKKGGNFRECFYLKTNDKNFPEFKIVYSGTVTLVKPKFKIESSKINLGKIPFGKVDTAFFKIKNIGLNPLGVGLDIYKELNSPDKNFQQSPLFVLKQNIPNRFLKIGESVIVKVLVENYYGNVGKFKRTIYLSINGYDSLPITVKATCVGKIFDSSIVLINKDSLQEKKTVYKYKKGCLESISESTIGKDPTDPYTFMSTDMMETVYSKCQSIRVIKYFNNKLEGVYCLKNNKYNGYKQIASFTRFYH